MQAEKQVEEIERALRKIEALQQMAVQEECLVTRTVDLSEVRRLFRGMERSNQVRV